MANINRNLHDLWTIRIDLRLSRDGSARVRFRTYHGRTQLAEHAVDAETIGIHSELSVRAYRDTHFTLDKTVRDILIDTLIRDDNADEPLWLQVGASAGHLAVVPWELLLQPELKRPLLRVPNFVAEPLFLSGPLGLVLCISSPRAKTPFSVGEYTRKFLDEVQNSIPTRSRIHIFTDLEAYDGLHQFCADRGDDRITLYDPHGADEFGAGGTDRNVGSAGSRIQSPWLLWMIEMLRGQNVDAVQFVCPGYFNRDNGALALARSPAENENRRWSHFIGADELMAFLTRLGAWTTIFSPPYENVWAIGLRLLADRLAWERPGPLVIHSPMHDAGFHDLCSAFRFLFSRQYEMPPDGPSLMMYTHPRRLERYAGPPADFVTSEPEVTTLDVEEEFAADLSSHLDREQLATLDEDAPAWKKAARLQIEQTMMELGGMDFAARRGALDALRQVRSLMEDIG